MTILEQIIANKREEIRAAKLVASEKSLSDKPLFSRDTLSLKSALLLKPGVIAEHKRRSPSKGMINDALTVESVVRGYAKGGARGVSILTDKQFFGAREGDIESVRNIIDIPILMKDFVIDPYQVSLAKSIGADVILLIASALDREQLIELAAIAKEMGLETLLEVHNEREVEKVSDIAVDLIGINSRDLKTFSVDTANITELVAKLPAKMVKVAESGIEDPLTAIDLYRAGFNGFLIGEAFMKQSDPGQACRSFVECFESSCAKA